MTRAGWDRTVLHPSPGNLTLRPTHHLEEGLWLSAQAPTPARWMRVGGMDATWVLHPHWSCLLGFL